jgi:hypothetical protein
MIVACTLCIAAITCCFGGVVCDRGAAGQPLLWEDKGREGGRRATVKGYISRVAFTDCTGFGSGRYAKAVHSRLEDF